jgi:flagellar hook protein FlgE
MLLSGIAAKAARHGARGSPDLTGGLSMGIFGALTTAVTGLRAQSFALENISGNIANSQTTGFKREDTSFVDLIPDDPPSKQLSGSVSASARATNTVQGDFQSASIGTFMAINGQGFFVVQKPSGVTDGRPTFAGADLYTRRGDFQTDKQGYLVNGAGYYIMGVPVDAKTGNVAGSVPQVLKFQNDFLPAATTTQIQYRANLASYPLTNHHDISVPGSELINPATFSANPVAGSPSAAKITGYGGTLAPDAAATITGSQVLPATMTNNGAFTINTTTVNITTGMTPAQVASAINTAAPAGLVLPPTIDGTGHLVLTSTNPDTAITIGGSVPGLLNELGLSVGTVNPTNLLTQSAVAAGQTLTIKAGANPTLTVTFGNGAGQVSTLAELQTALGGLSAGIASVNTTNGNITATASNLSDTLQIGGTATATVFGIHNLQGLPSNQQVLGMDSSTFIDQTIGGGAITCYDSSGAPVNLQIRWGKVDSATLGSGHTDTWNMFYQVDGNATGSQVAWQNAGVNYTFDPNGQENPLIANTTLNNVTVGGVSLGTLQIVSGAGGLTQFADTNGNAQVNLVQQDGFPAGSLQTVSISEKGRVVGTYSNGRTLDLAEISLATFNGSNQLKRLDGGAFEATDASGSAVLGASGKIVGSSLEGSNVDIADEFTKLIVTQQAYSANTRVITTSNTMVQDVLNMLR